MGRLWIIVFTIGLLQTISSESNNSSAIQSRNIISDYCREFPPRSVNGLPREKGPRLPLCHLFAFIDRMSEILFQLQRKPPRGAKNCPKCHLLMFQDVKHLFTTMPIDACKMFQNIKIIRTICTDIEMSTTSTTTFATTPSTIITSFSTSTTPTIITTDIKPSTTPVTIKATTDTIPSTPSSTTSTTTDSKPFTINTDITSSTSSTTLSVTSNRYTSTNTASNADNISTTLPSSLESKSTTITSTSSDSTSETGSTARTGKIVDLANMIISTITSDLNKSTETSHVTTISTPATYKSSSTIIIPNTSTMVTSDLTTANSPTTINDLTTIIDLTTITSTSTTINYDSTIENSSTTTSSLRTIRDSTTAGNSDTTNNDLTTLSLSTPNSRDTTRSSDATPPINENDSITINSPLTSSDSISTTNPSVSTTQPNTSEQDDTDDSPTTAPQHNYLFSNITTEYGIGEISSSITSTLNTEQTTISSELDSTSSLLPINNLFEPNYPNDISSMMRSFVPESKVIERNVDYRVSPKCLGSCLFGQLKVNKILNRIYKMINSNIKDIEQYRLVLIQLQRFLSDHKLPIHYIENIAANDIVVNIQSKKSAYQRNLDTIIKSTQKFIPFTKGSPRQTLQDIALLLKIAHTLPDIIICTLIGECPSNLYYPRFYKNKSRRIKQIQ